ncbi:Hypothetical predicted protein [Mytilus galloprovincialis]|uniref:C2H2-type domain-containing protein n=1 Tax=Mytilus galloprovincialis TaxID=29158 RepID=A0A8B6EXK1_MYTGA|nr:Hypothetical predicted protein [Mytilus galloprovincialis]
MNGFQILFVMPILIIASVSGCCWTHGGCFSTPYTCCETYTSVIYKLFEALYKCSVKPKLTLSQNIHSPNPGPNSTSPQPGTSPYRCRRCTAQFPDRRQQYLHGMREHNKTWPGAIQSRVMAK